MIHNSEQGIWGEGFGLEVAMRNKKGIYQASCSNGMEEKKSHHLRGLQGKQCPQGESPEPSFSLNKKAKEAEESF